MLLGLDLNCYDNEQREKIITEKAMTLVNPYPYM